MEFEPLEKNGYEEYPQLLTRIAGGNAPDVIRVLNFQPTQLVAQGDALLPLDEHIAATPDFAQDDFFPSVWGGSQVDGKTYAIPQNGEPYTLYFNADAFEKAGLESPQAQFEAGTWDQAAFEAAIDGLMGAGGMRFGVAFESWNYDNFCFMGGGTVLDEALTPTIDQGASPAMLDLFAKLVADGKAPSPVVGGGANLEPFKNGQVGMYIMGPWWGPALEATPPGFTWGVTGLPGVQRRHELQARDRLAGHLGRDEEPRRGVGVRQDRHRHRGPEHLEQGGHPDAQVGARRLRLRRDRAGARTRW